jgi:hypothetical protein
MERTGKSQFIVHTPDNSSVFSSSSSTHLWFEVLEGEDQGKRVRVPLPPYGSYYEDEPEIAKVLLDLNDGEFVTAILERSSKSDLWHPILLSRCESRV